MATQAELYPGHQMRTFRLRTDNGPSSLQGILAVAEDAGAQLGEMRVVASGPGAVLVRDVSLYFANSAQLEVLVAGIGKVEGVALVDVLHDALEVRRGGVVETRLRVPLESIADLRRVYTPGV